MNQFLIQFAQKVDIDGIPKLTGEQLLTNSLNLAYFIAGAVAVLVMIVAGVMFASSTGSPGRVAIARNTMIYAGVGLIVVISAFAITNFVIGSLK